MDAGRIVKQGSHAELLRRHGSAVHQLTDVGRALEPVVTAVWRWGARFLGEPRKTDTLLPNAYFVAMPRDLPAGGGGQANGDL